jgi:hypothetical protein
MQKFYLTRVSDGAVSVFSLGKLRSFAKDYLRGAYGIATHQWLISTKKP